MLKYFICTALMAISLTTRSQDIYTISLAKFSIKPDGISLKISEIIDGRKDKKVIGIIQRGLQNRMDLAVFESPGLQEVGDLIKRSNLFLGEKGIVMRVSKLTISELTATWRETSKAELSVDFFISYQNSYYYIRSIYATIEPNAVDVTHLHSENIVAVIENAFAQFSARENEIRSEQAFSKEELMDPDLNFRATSSMPIVEATHYKDGYFVSYDEFIENKPSIPIDCVVKLDEKSTVKCGAQERQTEIYGFAKDNQLYVAFHRAFYPLEKVNNEFIFVGPRAYSSKDFNEMARGAVVPRQVDSKRGHNAQYKIDLATGSIKNENGF